MKTQNINLIKKLTASYVIVMGLILVAACSSKNGTTASDDMGAENSTEDVYELSTTQFHSSDMKLGKL